MPKVHDEPPEESEPFSLPLIKCGLAGPRLSRIPGLPNKPDASEKIKRIVSPTSLVIKLVDWNLIESAEKKATEVLSRGNKTPTREAVCELTRLILEDLKKD